MLSGASRVAADERDQRHVAGKQAEGRAVFRCEGIDVIRRAQAPGPRHRQVFADVARQQAGIDVIAAARPEADDQIDAVAAIEIGDLVGARRRNNQDQEAQASGYRARRPRQARAALSGTLDPIGHVTEDAEKAAVFHMQGQARSFSAGPQKTVLFG